MTTNCLMMFPHHHNDPLPDSVFPAALHLLNDRSLGAALK